ncbi:G8 domain-containing protein [Tenacibaculum sp. 190524A05c]|uniref:G8 domain-containing protein n=1 Tax=Tenacibaculum platacis TaxID=3137852 RepID=UPI0032B26990
MKSHKLLYLVVLFALTFFNSEAQTPIQVAGTPTKTAIQNGNWTDVNTWGGSLPQNDDRILIPSNITVTVDGMIPQEFKSVRIAMQGTLQYATNVNTELRTEFLVSEMGANFNIGTPSNPINSNVNASLVFAWRGGTTKAQDNNRFVPGAVLMGPVRMEGSPKTSWTTVANYPLAGDNQLTLKQTPTGWKIGDKLTVAGTDVDDYQSDEVVTITGISGTTIMLSNSLIKNHQPPTELNNLVDVHVSNNTRNIVISSENSSVTALSGVNGYDKPRGHIMFMHNSNVQIRNVETNNLGRTDKTIELDDWSVPEEGPEDQPDPRFSTTVPYPAGAGRNPRGRYSIHFHRSLDRDANKALVEGCVVNNDPGWAFVNHSSYVDFINNVSYGVVGSAYCTEAGDELGSFKNNIAIRTYNPNEPLNLGRPMDGVLGINGGRTDGLTDGREQISDFAHQGDGFWLHSTGVTLEGNVVSGCSGHAYIYWTEGLWESLRGRPQMQNKIDLYVPPTEFPNLNAELKTQVAQHPNWIFDVWYVLPRPFKNNIGYTTAQGFRGDYIMTEFHENGETTSREYNMMPTNYRNTMNLIIENSLFWGIRRTGMQFENCAQITIKNNKIYGYGASTGFAPWNPNPNPYPGRLEIEPHSIGIDLDHYHNTRNWTIENNVISGWDGASQALTLPMNATVRVNGGTFDNSGTDIFIREVNWNKNWIDRIIDNTETTSTPSSFVNPTPTDLTTPWRTINIEGNIVFNNSTKNIVLDAQFHLLNNAGDAFALLHPDGSGVKMTTYFLLPDDIRLNFGDFNNTKVYFDEQDPNFVPVPTSDLLTPYLYPTEDLFPERVTPGQYLNKSNAQLKSEFGSSFGGEFLPTNATTHPMISGGKIVNSTLSNPDIPIEENKCIIYPNPASSSFSIKSINRDLDVHIYSLQGNLIKTTSSTQNGIDVSQLSTGIYIVQIQDQNSNFVCTKKLIKK